MLFGLNQTMQYSAPESWIPCDTEGARLLCPSKSSPWSKVRRTCTQWLPKNLASTSTLVHWFSSLPPASPDSLLGVLTRNDVLSKCNPPVSLVLLSIGACLVNPPVWLTCWSKLGATSRRLHLSALEHVRHFGFAVPLQVDVLYVPVVFSCGSGAYSKEYLWHLKSSPNKFSFPPLVCVHVSLILLLPWQFRDKCPRGQDCWWRLFVLLLLRFSGEVCSLCVPLLPPIKY